MVDDRNHYRPVLLNVRKNESPQNLKVPLCLGVIFNVIGYNYVVNKTRFVKET